MFEISKRENDGDSSISASESNIENKKEKIKTKQKKSYKIPKFLVYYLI